jgi:hypothetical protein
MPAVVVGGVTIPIAASAPGHQDMDDGVDRGRAFNNTYRASATGGAARDFRFTTPPLLRSDADIFDIVLRTVAAQTCSGDIIALPTMCCAERTGWTPVTVKGGHRVVIDFTLHEVQPALALLKYAPGDSVTGEAFTRSTTAYQINASGVPVSIAINTKRDGHYIGGVRSLLLEDTRTNGILWANDLSNAAWTKASATIATGVADPTGGTGASTITSTAPTGNAQQSLSAGSSIVRCNSIWIRRRTGSGNVDILPPDNGAWQTKAVTGSWQRFSAVGSASTARFIGIRLATSGDAVDVWCCQQDNASFASSEIPTTGVAVTRGADSYSLPFTAPPQELSVYTKFVEGGSISTNGARLWQVSNAANATPAALVSVAGGVYASEQDTTAGGVASGVSPAPSIGLGVENLARLFGDGSVDDTQSIAGGSATSGAQSAALALAAAWSGQLCWLNSAGTSGGVGFTAIQSLKIIAGARSLAEMRAA